jgi:hypothetical protein
MGAIMVSTSGCFPRVSGFFKTWRPSVWDGESVSLGRIVRPSLNGKGNTHSNTDYSLDCVCATLLAVLMLSENGDWCLPDTKTSRLNEIALRRARGCPERREEGAKIRLESERDHYFAHLKRAPKPATIFRSGSGGPRGGIFRSCGPDKEACRRGSPVSRGRLQSDEGRLHCRRHKLLASGKCS